MLIAAIIGATTGTLVAPMMKPSNAKPRIPKCIQYPWLAQISNPLIAKLPLAPRSNSPRYALMQIVPNLAGLLPMSLLSPEELDKERHGDEEKKDGWLKSFVDLYPF